MHRHDTNVFGAGGYFNSSCDGEGEGEGDSSSSSAILSGAVIDGNGVAPSVMSGAIGDTDGMSIDGMAVGIPLAVGSVSISGIDSGVAAVMSGTIGDIDGMAIDGMADGIPLGIGSVVSMSSVGSANIVGPTDADVDAWVSSTSTSSSTTSVVISTDGVASMAASIEGDMANIEASADSEFIGLSVFIDGVDIIRVGIASDVDNAISPLDGIAS